MCLLSSPPPPLWVVLALWSYAPLAFQEASAPSQPADTKLEEALTTPGQELIYIYRSSSIYIYIDQHDRSSWLLLAPLGSSWLLLASPGSSWLHLAPPDSRWLLMAPQGFLLFRPSYFLGLASLVNPTRGRQGEVGSPRASHFPGLPSLLKPIRGRQGEVGSPETSYFLYRLS